MERLASGLFLHWAKISVPISGKSYVDVILDYRLLAERNYLENRCWCWDSPSCPGVFSARQTGASFWGLISSSAPPLLVCKSTSSHCWPGSFNQHQLTLQDEVPFQFLSLGFVYPQCLSAGDEKYMELCKASPGISFSPDLGLSDVYHCIPVHWSFLWKLHPSIS